MAIARPWRAPRPDGPYPATPDDHAALNHVFSEAFTERYRRDGLVGVRVPFLNPAIWRYAIEDANGGALVWRDERGEIAAFNIVHCSGREGWMGPLAVRPDAQGSGLGKEIVRSGIDWLMAAKALTIGLETMPRTMDNIGFYSSLGFSPGRLTVTVTIDAAPASESASLFGRLSARDKNDVLMESSELSQSVLPACDFAREIELTDALGLGETILFREGDKITGFALVHTVPLVEGRARDETRVLKLVLSKRAHLASAVATLGGFREARRNAARGVQGADRVSRVVSAADRDGRARAVDGSADGAVEVSGGEGEGGAAVE